LLDSPFNLGLQVDGEEAVAHGGHHEGHEAEPDGGDQHHLAHRGLHTSAAIVNNEYGVSTVSCTAYDILRMSMISLSCLQLIKA
jgi:hypothetical protein